MFWFIVTSTGQKKSILDVGFSLILNINAAIVRFGMAIGKAFVRNNSPSKSIPTSRSLCFKLNVQWKIKCVHSTPSDIQQKLLHSKPKQYTTDIAKVTVLRLWYQLLTQNILRAVISRWQEGNTHYNNKLTWSSCIGIIITTRKIYEYRRRLTFLRNSSQFHIMKGTIPPETEMTTISLSSGVKCPNSGYYLLEIYVADCGL